ncbi:MAG: endo alpha-1,4 polygalactosaminidase [Fervidobacterium sp.]
MTEELVKHIFIVLILVLVSILAFTTELPQDWILFTNGSNIEQLAGTKANIVIIDYSADGTDAKAFSASEISFLKSSGKKVFAYLNLGIAENWRFYWKNLNKSIILSPLENWPGEFYVKYWYNEWYDAVKSYLNKIKKAGFDGVMFDWINVYKNDTLQKISRKSESELENAMYELLTKITKDYPNFEYALVNSEELLSKYPDLIAKIKYVVVESLFYNRLALNVYSSDFSKRIKLLIDLQKRGTVVLSVEYIDNNNPLDKSNTERIKQYIELAKKYNVLYYVAKVDMMLNCVNIPRILAGS